MHEASPQVAVFDSGLREAQGVTDKPLDGGGKIPISSSQGLRLLVLVLLALAYPTAAALGLVSAPAAVAKQLQPAAALGPASASEFGPPIGGVLVDECAFVAKRRGEGPPPVVAFLVGLEGTGHHLVTAVVDELNTDPGLVAEQQPRLDLEVSDDEGPAGTALLQFLHSHPGTHFFYRSYPAGSEGRYDFDAGARVSLVKLLCLNATGAIDLRLAYLRRHPVDAVCSALRRYVPNHTQEIEKTAEMALESFLYIDSVLSYAAAPYEVIDFAEVIKDKATLQGPLESLLRGLATPEAIQTAIERTRVDAACNSKHECDGGRHKDRASCDDVHTREIVASRMQPASNGSLPATLQAGPMQKDYWHLDSEHLRNSTGFLHGDHAGVGGESDEG